MPSRRLVCGAGIIVFLVTLIAASQQHSPGAAPTPVPELQRLASLFVGNWDTTETMERSEDFPRGGGRHGISHWHLGVGGTTLIGEGHSDGSVGPLEHMIVI